MRLLTCFLLALAATALAAPAQTPKRAHPARWLDVTLDRQEGVRMAVGGSISENWDPLSQAPPCRQSLHGSHGAEEPVRQVEE